MYLCAMGIELHQILLFDFGTVPTMWYFLFFIFIKTRVNSPSTIGNNNPVIYILYMSLIYLFTHFFLII